MAKTAADSGSSFQPSQPRPEQPRLGLPPRSGSTRCLNFASTGGIPSHVAPARSAKLTHLQCLRGLAALIVVLSHFPHWSNAGIGAVPIYNVGILAVYVFFGISGYVIAHAHRDETGAIAAGAYLVKRIFRLYPAYLFYSALALAVHVAGWSSWDTAVAQTRSTGEFATAVTLIPIPSLRCLPFIGVGWSLFFEVTFYLLFISFFAGRRAGLITMAAFAAAIFVNESGLVALPFWVTTPSLLFVAGCALGLYRQPLRLSRPSSWLAIAGGATLMGVSLALAKFSLAYPSALVGTGAITLGTIGLDWTAGRRSHGIVHRALERLGDISYSLYLCHTVVQTALFHVVGAPTKSWTAATLFIAVPLAFASVSYRLIERPAQRIGRMIVARMSAKTKGDAAPFEADGRARYP